MHTLFSLIQLSLMDKERNELSVQVASIRRENGKLLHELEKMQKKGKKSVSSANTEGRTVFLEKKIAELEVENNVCLICSMEKCNDHNYFQL